MAALIPVDESEREDFILAHTPEYVASMAAADVALAEGRTIDHVGL